MKSYDRRTFLLWSGFATASALWLGVPKRWARADDLGPLVPDPNGILDLPPGYSYQIIDQTGDLMTDNYRVPGEPDGMACFPGEPGTIVLMRNHELQPYQLDLSAYGPNQTPPEQAYDPVALGGVTRVVLHESTLERISSNLVLVGTTRNCAGGPSPWGWLSCEENVDEGHGYVFLCPTDAQTVAAPNKIPGYGRFYHEAVAIDPENHTAYLTEDRSDGYLYRFVPDDPASPFEGRLQAMRHAVVYGFDTDWMSLGQSIPVSWVDVDEPDPVGDTIRGEVYLKGGARVIRAEGIWFANGSVYICSTSGGPVQGGQIFRLDPGDEQDSLTLIAVSEDRSILDMPDNITMSPWGDLFMAEDGDGAQFIRALTPEGDIYDFARNAKSEDELAGVCFSPSGDCLFVNLQKDGLTLAITGSFPKAAVEPEPDPELIPSNDTDTSSFTDGLDSIDGSSADDAKDGFAVHDPGTGFPPEVAQELPARQDTSLDLGSDTQPEDLEPAGPDSGLIGLDPSEQGGCSAGQGALSNLMIPAVALGAYLVRTQSKEIESDPQR